MSDVAADFKQILDNQPCVTFRLYYDGRNWLTRYVTKGIERYGYARDDFMSGKMGWVDLLHPDDRVLALKQSHDYAIRQIDDFKLQYRIRTQQGKSVWITEFSHLNRAADGSQESIDSMLVENLELGGGDSARDELRRNIALNDILLTLHDADLENAIQVILDRAGAYLDCSRALLFKDSPDHKTCKVVYEWLNKDISSIKDLDYAVTYATEMPEIYVALQKTGVLLVNAGHIPENCKEEFEHEGLVSSAIFAVYLHGDHFGFVCFDDCVIERTWDEDTANFLKIISSLLSTVLMRMQSGEMLLRYEERIKELAFRDRLTDLPNRYQCEADMADAILDSGQAGSPDHLILIELDGLKAIRDGEGHEFSDGVAVAFADFLRETFAGDSQAKLYSLGTSEFVILVEHKRITPYLDAIVQRAGRPWAVLDREFECPVSVGVADFGGKNTDPKAIIRQAGMARSQAVAQGRNHYAFYGK